MIYQWPSSQLCMDCMYGRALLDTRANEYACELNYVKNNGIRCKAQYTIEQEVRKTLNQEGINCNDGLVEEIIEFIADGGYDRWDMPTVIEDFFVAENKTMERCKS